MKEQEYDLVETKALYTVLQGNYQDLKEENSSMKEEIDLLDDKIESLEAENVKLTEEAERNIYLNQNFIRIAKERANSQNGKSKTDSGYSVIYSGQYYDPDFYAPIWRTYIRTPYNAGIPIDNIRQTIRQDLLYDVLGKIGIEVLQKFQKNGVYENWEDKDGRLMNAAYKILYKSNFREGFWEIELFHITPVFVPHELRPSLKTSSNTKGRRDNHDKKSNNKH